MITSPDEKTLYFQDIPERTRLILDFSYLDFAIHNSQGKLITRTTTCLLYTSDAADERSSVDLGGRRIIKKKKIEEEMTQPKAV